MGIVAQTFGGKKKESKSKSKDQKNATARRRLSREVDAAPEPAKSYGVKVVEFWDMGASQHQDRLWSAYFPGTEIIIWVIDSSNKKRILESAELLQAVLTDPTLPL